MALRRQTDRQTDSAVVMRSLGRRAQTHSRHTDYAAAQCNYITPERKNAAAAAINAVEAAMLHLLLFVCL